MKAVSLLVHSLLAGVLMAGFILVPGASRFLLSLVAVLIGLRFFRQYDNRKLRIGFVSTAVGISFVLPVVYVVLAVRHGWPVDPHFLQGVSFTH